jgi:arylsulfatase
MAVGGKTFKVHLDGYNITDALAGKSPSPRKEFFYFNDDGSLVGPRYNQWKIVFAEQRQHGFDVWREPFVPLRLPKLFNLRRDPFERADENSNTYWDWMISHAYVIYMMQAVVASQIENFVKFPPRQKAASFNLDAVMRDLEAAKTD